METNPDNAATQGSPSLTNERIPSETNRLLLKAGIIAALILLMLIPSAYIISLVKERSERQEQVIKEVSNKWAEPQTITGPILMIPYKDYTRQADGKMLESKKKAYFLPDQLDIKGKLLPETRHRSLYDVTLYRTDVNLAGSFGAIDFAALGISAENVIWNEARVMIGIDDTRGLEEEITIDLGGSPLKMDAGLPENPVLRTGLNAPFHIANPVATTTFRINIKAKGSEYFYFTPVGKTTNVTIASSWENPAFDGKYLPTVSDISATGFSANWKILQASRNYPQAWLNSGQKLQESSFGVRLIQPTDTYTKTERSVKYALLFIGLTFTIFFFIELLQKKQIHPLQYLLVGFALLVFYTLLLSFSEYIGFNIAYCLASAATVILIGLYVKSLFKKMAIAVGFTLALSALYAYIFFLIQLQDYALLFGSIGLFIVVALAMYSSRKVDWYHLSRKTPAINH